MTNNCLEMWQLHYFVVSIGKKDDRILSRFVDFQAKDDKEAKMKILDLLKCRLARVKWTKNRLLL